MLGCFSQLSSHNVPIKLKMEESDDIETTKHELNKWLHHVHGASRGSGWVPPRRDLTT